MSTRRKQLVPILVLVGGLVALFGTMSLSLTRHADAQDKPVAAPKNVEPSSGDTADRKADRAGIDAQMEGFLKAFESGDAERVASFWTAGGELIDDDGRVYRGRAAIAKAYRELFGTKEKRRAEIQR